ncbi:Decaprenyl diphosphate synthase-like protein [Pavlovales sp. CCMP2436]|nr:Decaprenyl diphosphate synthase-like protein [Pavlovales sp. CCMP2436]
MVSVLGLPWYIRLACAIFRAGKVPRHVALIMDGNRRYARDIGVDLRSGHTAGFVKLEQVLEWCLELGVEAVTVFAFSIDNFRRPPAEVDALMVLAREKFAYFQTRDSVVHRHGIRLQLVGDLDLLPRDVREEMQRAVSLTLGRTGPLLNVCFAYTAQYELLHAARTLAAAVRAGELDPEDIDEEALSRAMPTNRAPDGTQVPPVDLLIRTSGEQRLSNFLLWQVSGGARLAFISALWPSLSAWSFFSVLVRYQLSVQLRAAQRSVPRAPPRDLAAAAR